MKKIMILFLLLMMVLTLVACGKGEPSPESTSIFGTYEVTGEKPATFVITDAGNSTPKGRSITVTMIGESSEQELQFVYDNETGEAFMGGVFNDQNNLFFDDLIYFKLNLKENPITGEGYIRWGVKGEEKIPFSMIKKPSDGK
jgi:hypothetical protein